MKIKNWINYLICATHFIAIVNIFILFPVIAVADNPVPTDPDWVILDESTPNATESLNSVINELIDNGSNKFFIKNGSYNLTGAISITTPNIVILGESKNNTKLIQTNGTSNSIEIKNTFSVTVSDLTIDNQNAGISFLCQNCDDVRLINSIIYGSGTNTAVAFYGKQCSNDIDAVESNDLDDSNKIEGNIIYSYLPDAGVKDGVIFTKQKNGSIIDNDIFGSRIAFYLSRNCEVSYNQIIDSQTNGIRYTVPAYDNKILFNNIQNTKASGISVDRDSKDATPIEYRAERLEICNNTINQSHYFGIEINNLKDSKIENNLISDIDFTGIYLLFSDFLSIKNNSINNCNRSRLNGNLWGWNENLNCGIFADYMVTYSDIIDNEINNLNNDNYNCPFGIRIQPDNTNHHNNVIDNFISGYFDYGTSIKIGDPVYNTDSNQINISSRSISNIKSLATSNQITISWDPVDWVSAYYIEVDGVEIDIADQTSYIHTGLISNTVHYYRVRTNGGNWSDIISITTTPILIPTSIEAEDLVITKSQSTQIKAILKDQFNNKMDGYSFKYEIQNPDVASVDASGLVTAKKAGETYLIISVDGTGLSKTIKIIVKENNPIPPTITITSATTTTITSSTTAQTSITTPMPTSIEAEDIVVTEKQTPQIIVKEDKPIPPTTTATTPTSTTAQTSTTTTTQTSIRAEDIVITEKQTVKIIVKKDRPIPQTITAQTSITTPTPTSIEAEDIVIAENQSTQIKAILKDQFNNKVDGYIFKYEIQNPDVSSVDEHGFVTAKKAGETYLTITVDGTDLSKTIKFIVKEDKPITPKKDVINKIIIGIMVILSLISFALLANKNKIKHILKNL